MHILIKTLVAIIMIFYYMYIMNLMRPMPVVFKYLENYMHYVLLSYIRWIY